MLIFYFALCLDLNVSRWGGVEVGEHYITIIMHTHGFNLKQKQKQKQVGSAATVKMPPPVHRSGHMKQGREKSLLSG